MKFSSFTLLLGVVGQTLAAGTVQVGWSTDPAYNQEGYSLIQPTWGPDGPWQGVVVELGNFTNSTGLYDPAAGNLQGVYTVLYPCGSGRTLLLPPGPSGNYSYSGSNKSNTVVEFSSFEGEPDDWDASIVLNTTSDGRGIQDIVAVPDKLEEKTPSANASLWVDTEEWNIRLPSSKEYNNTLGILGLGRPSDSLGLGGGESPGANISSLLDSFKSKGDIGSSSFGLHIGSVTQQIGGSLVLGGYDQSRVIGPVATFNYLNGLPFSVLMDVTLGAARCDSPFPEGSIKQLYKGTADSPPGAQLTAQLGAPKGSALVIPNPAAPYMWLPLGTCEAVATHLPVTFNKDVGLYTWNQDDPQFVKVVNSSAYLEFIFNDATATNISIKVPFKLLNLTLESPIVDTPIQYFPCSPLNSTYGFWELGRSFLQAAFLGVNYDQNKTFMAQAPGPGLNQSVIKEIDSSDTSLTSTQPDALGSLISSWQDAWTSPVCTNGQTSPNTSGTSNSDDSTGLSGGAIAGIVLGVLAGVALIALAVFFLWYKPRRNARSADPSSDPAAGPMMVAHQEKRPAEGEFSPDLHKSDMPMSQRPSEVAGNDVRHEVGGEQVEPRYELPTAR
ncbi:hypothetical protein MMC10_008570 [Thelotrema lepadinum]|nr:hypothetical protein [Thelotrema lepadinum]